jgi:hypothetical protein
MDQNAAHQTKAGDALRRDGVVGRGVLVGQGN